MELDPDKVLYALGTLGYLVAWLAFCVLVIVWRDRGRK